MLQHLSEVPPFSRLNNVPLFVYHILSIHLSMSGHLGCSHRLATVTDAAMKMRVQISLQDPVFTSIGYSEIELLGHMVIVLLIF